MPLSASVATAPDVERTANAALTISRLFRSMERVEAGLTPQQYRMLKLIGAGGERSARLAERLTVAKPTLTSTADGLVAAGLLNREPESSDRRVVRLRLTEAGLRAVSHADQVYSAWLSELLEIAGNPDELLRGFELLDQAFDRRLAAKLKSTSTGSTDTGLKDTGSTDTGAQPARQSPM